MLGYPRLVDSKDMGAYFPRMKSKYRNMNMLTRMSAEYAQALECPEEIRERFKACLKRFESCAVTMPVEVAVAVFDFDLHESHLPFLKRLHEHIRALTHAELAEQLRDNVSSKDGVAASKQLMDIMQHGHAVDVEGMETDASGNVSIVFNVKPPAGDVQVTRGIDAE